MYRIPNWLTVSSQTLAMTGLDDAISRNFELGGVIASEPQFLSEGYNVCKIWGVRRNLEMCIRVDRDFAENCFRFTIISKPVLIEKAY